MTLFLWHLLLFASVTPWWQHAFFYFYHHIHPLVKDSPFSKPPKRKYHPHQLSSSLSLAHMSAHGSPLQGLLQLSACLGVQVKWKNRRMRTSQQMMRFNSGSESNPDLHPVFLTLVRVEAWLYSINIHAAVYVHLPLAASLEHIVSPPHWHLGRQVARCPLHVPLMASTRMDGFIFNVPLVISQHCVYILGDLLV